MFCEFCGRVPTCGVCGRNDKLPHPRDRSARFWVYVAAGWVKLTVPAGGRLKHAHGGATDEGYACEWNTWERTEDGAVCWEWASDGRDCDGRHSAGGVLVADLDKLEANDLTDIGGPLCPDWDVEEKYQREENAELAGY